MILKRRGGPRFEGITKIYENAVNLIFIKFHIHIKQLLLLAAWQRSNASWSLLLKCCAIHGFIYLRYTFIRHRSRPHYDRALRITFTLVTVTLHPRINIYRLHILIHISKNLVSNTQSYESYLLYLASILIIILSRKYGISPLIDTKYQLENPFIIITPKAIHKYILKRFLCSNDISDIKRRGKI